ncbi:MAG: low-specificity L-threonine aldolase [Planctomycetota bacterium]|nr:low-specificity L-threonine aldolase [Planctomycetota bacterium]
MPTDQNISDFRSDTVTQPCAAMREAMARAKVGDDVFGDDPTVNDLQARAAKLFGKERALFVPSGTMGNLIATKLHSQPGDEIIVEKTGHMYNSEGGGGAWIAGVQVRTLNGPEGKLCPDEVRKAIRPDDAHCPKTSLLTIENTHNFYGGRVVPLAHLKKLRAVADEAKIAVHMDGARVMNAVVASGTEAREYGKIADTIMCCLSKGLGAPIGSLLLGSDEHIAKAHRYRKALGGGMRQVGIVAAAGILALEEGPKQLVEDHKNARALADGFNAIDGLILNPSHCETNILFVKSAAGPDADKKIAAALAEEKILSIAIGDLGIRFVTHRHIDESDIERTISVMKRVLPRFLT